ncbi:hypothetical protein [Hoeflea poritis]|uniref:Bile acid:sodium symporter n=1 Tax=Hoeflea poritis TaxID=2993659 RepID=A0ABT4VKY4_9HYPH|nr:hypothetical protein [Hoeflea poritis]MDA4845368.1 hypothetical protein [Hoeflea poritis]
MKLFLAPFQFAARHGRWLLVLGLVAGVALPGLAAFMERQLPFAVALLLFFSALRVGPRQAVGAARDLGHSLYFVVILQVVCPLMFVGVLIATGWQSPLAFGLALMLTASPISGSPSLTILLGKDGAPALRLLIAGTALLPLTSIPVFWLLPDLIGGEGIFGATLRLLALIGIAAGLAFLIRGTAMKDPGPAGLGAIEGMAALTLAVMVVGLMSAIRPAITENPSGLVINLIAAFAANFGLQAATYLILKRPLPRQSAGLAVSAGNRNIALFLAALPAGVMEPLLLFIGCYQVPMFLTPMLLRRFYR